MIHMCIWLASWVKLSNSYNRDCNALQINNILLNKRPKRLILFCYFNAVFYLQPRFQGYYFSLNGYIHRNCHNVINGRLSCFKIIKYLFVVKS